MLLRRFYIQENEKAPEPKQKKTRELKTDIIPLEIANKELIEELSRRNRKEADIAPPALVLAPGNAVKLGEKAAAKSTTTKTPQESGLAPPTNNTSSQGAGSPSTTATKELIDELGTSRPPQTIVASPLEPRLQCKGGSNKTATGGADGSGDRNDTGRTE
jgi:hypothetical protein